MSGGQPATEVKLFGKWGLDEIEINDISLTVSGINNPVGVVVVVDAELNGQMFHVIA